jgi:hypothetical protein
MERLVQYRLLWPKRSFELKGSAGSEALKKLGDREAT